MSDVSVDIIKNRSGEAPDLPSGANLSGVSTAATLQVTNLNPTHINASGVTTATTFSGSMKSTGTPTLGLGVTINSSGINISGVATAGIVSATTLYGDGSNMTGVAMSIAPISYNPDVNDSIVPKASGIGITFTERIKAGSGNVTLRIAGAAGTVVENFGVGSSVTINNNTVSIDPTSDLNNSETYHISYPSGCFTNTSGDVDYVGTAYTFGTKALQQTLWMWGTAGYGDLAQNDKVTRSSPVQIPGNNWGKLLNGQLNSFYGNAALKTDNTLWVWGYNDNGHLGLNSLVNYSSPVQVPGTTWNFISASYDAFLATKTDGTLWAWGKNSYGSMGVNNRTQYSSPVQVGSETTWGKGKWQLSSGAGFSGAVKTDGTLWVWGRNAEGRLGHNNPDNAHLSSPTQIPGTTWRSIACSQSTLTATKTDGTLWTCGENTYGTLGVNDRTKRSSPTQVPGTTWAENQDSGGGGYNVWRRTDGTIWSCGTNGAGQLGQNSETVISSPTQIGSGTDWKQASTGDSNNMFGLKTDGTLWGWGDNGNGGLGINHITAVSSPTQIPGTTWNGVKGARTRAYGLQVL